MGHGRTQSMQSRLKILLAYDDGRKQLKHLTATATGFGNDTRFFIRS